MEKGEGKFYAAGVFAAIFLGAIIGFIAGQRHEVARWTPSEEESIQKTIEKHALLNQNLQTARELLDTAAKDSVAAIESSNSLEKTLGLMPPPSPAE